MNYQETQEFLEHLKKQMDDLLLVSIKLEELGITEKLTETSKKELHKILSERFNFLEWSINEQEEALPDTMGEILFPGIKQLLDDLTIFSKSK